MNRDMTEETLFAVGRGVFDGNQHKVVKSFPFPVKGFWHKLNVGDIFYKAEGHNAGMEACVTRHTLWLKSQFEDLLLAEFFTPGDPSAEETILPGGGIC